MERFTIIKSDKSGLEIADQYYDVCTMVQSCAAGTLFGKVAVWSARRIWNPNIPDSSPLWSLAGL